MLTIHGGKMDRDMKLSKIIATIWIAIETVAIVLLLFQLQYNESIAHICTDACIITFIPLILVVTTTGLNISVIFLIWNEEIKIKLRRSKT